MKYARRFVSVFLTVMLALMLCCVTALADEGSNTVPTTATSTTSNLPSATNDENSSSGGVWGLLSGESLKKTFMELFTETIANFFSGIVNSIIDLVDELSIKLLDSVFHAESLVNANGTVLSSTSLRNVYQFIYIFACALVALKFIFKGFQIYVLWRGGDAEASPRDMAVGVAEATVIMVAFPWLYERIVDVFKYLAEGVMGRLGVSAIQGTGFLSPLKITLDVAGAIVPLLLKILFLLIFFILMFVLWIKLIRQGFELLIMRLGVPLATLGMIDSDMALTKNYFQTLLKVGITVIIQVTLMSLSFRVIVTGDTVSLLAAIALMATAMSAPRLLQQFLTPQAQGGGLMNKAYSAAMVARTAKMLFV